MRSARCTGSASMTARPSLPVRREVAGAGGRERAGRDGGGGVAAARGGEGRGGGRGSLHGYRVRVAEAGRQSARLVASFAVIEGSGREQPFLGGFGRIVLDSCRVEQV